MWTKEGLIELVESRLRDYGLIIVSNREPYVHHYASGEIVCARPASGLTTALEPVIRACGGTWVAHGSGEADRETVNLQDHVRVPPDDPRFTLRRVWLTKEQEARYYYGLANEGLWPLCHIVFARPVFRPEDWKAYREVNELFARAVLDEAGDRPTFVFIQDYHFGLLARRLKESNPNLIIAQFWHIPWPNPEVFRGFPWKEELLEGLLGSDLLGFHLPTHCQNFLDTVDRTIEAKVDQEKLEITRSGKPTLVRSFPISLDAKERLALAQSEATAREMVRWRQRLGLRDELVGVGVDRIDYTKGICERLRAVDRFLTRCPSYRKRLLFVQVGAPSRTRIRQYHLVEEEIDRLVQEINWKWESGSWRPIWFFKEHVEAPGVTALYRLAHFCMVTSLHDGMNLVSKEFVASRFDQDGVLILSEFAGAARELTDAILVNPFSEEQLAAAIEQALEMPEEMRRRRMSAMQAAVVENNIYRWAGKILSALLRLESAVNVATDVRAAA